MPSRSNNSSNVDSKEKDNEISSSADLEGSILALSERWDVCMAWIEGRFNTLCEVSVLWAEFNDERAILVVWLDSVEKALKSMERSPTQEHKQLEQQAKDIGVSNLLICYFKWNINLIIS